MANDEGMPNMSSSVDPGVTTDPVARQLLAAQASEIAALKAQLHQLHSQIEQLISALSPPRMDPALSAVHQQHDTPLVSVITPSLNQARYIRETIESVLAQDHSRVEHIIVDGGSEDGTVDILRAYEAQYPGRVRWISEPDNGQSDAVNKGLALSRGTIIGWQNSDDYYYPNVFAEAVRYLAGHDDVGVVYGDCDVVDICRNVTGKFSVSPFDLPLLLRMTCVANQSAFIRREVLERCGGLSSDYHYAMDHDLWLRLALVTNFAYLPGIRGAFRVQPAGKIQNGFLWNRLEVVEMLKRLASNPMFPQEYSPVLHQSVAQFALQAMKLAILQGRSDIAERSLTQALQYDPEMERFADLCTKLVEGLVGAATASAPGPPAIGASLPKVALSAPSVRDDGRLPQRRRLDAIAHLYAALACRGRSSRVALGHVRRAIAADPWWLALDDVREFALASAGCGWAASSLGHSYRHAPWLYRSRAPRPSRSARSTRQSLQTWGGRLKAPVALLIYNRPEHTRAVFERIRQYGPPTLYIVADGPRDEEDRRRCEETRDIVRGVDWACDVRTDFAATNLGCAERVSSGLDWVFGQSETAIILEDDCVPDPSFFDFCTELLDRYRDDSSVGMISGFNMNVRSNVTTASYYFARSVHVWGWATWSRAWRDYDHSMRLWPELRDTGWLRQVHTDAKYVGLLATLIDGAYKGFSDSWSFRWMLSFWLNDYLAVLPNTNLVTNIGFDDSATHTRSTRDYRSRIRSRAMPLPLVHPDEVRADEDAERRITQRVLEDEHHMYRGAAGVLRRAEHAGVGLASAVRQHVLAQRARGAS